MANKPIVAFIKPNAGEVILFNGNGRRVTSIESYNLLKKRNPDIRFIESLNFTHTNNLN